MGIHFARRVFAFGGCLLSLIFAMSGFAQTPTSLLNPQQLPAVQGDTPRDFLPSQPSLAMPDGPVMNTTATSPSGTMPTHVIPQNELPKAPEPAVATPPAFEILWKNGFVLQSKDKEFVGKVGGTVHYDAAFYQAASQLQRGPGNIGPFSDGANLRRARLRLEGTLYTTIDYMLEFEFANGFSPAGLSVPVAPNTVSNSVGPTDAWITIKEVPWIGNIRIGSQKEPISLEHLNSYRYLEFMERSYLFDMNQATAFNNGFSPGISAFRGFAEDRIFVHGGFFKNESDLNGYGINDGNYAATGRLAFLPLYEPDQERFIHLGGSVSHRDPVNGQVQVRVRESVRNAPFPLLNLIANTGPITTRSQDIFNLECAAVNGPLTFQAEYLNNQINNAQPPGFLAPLGTLMYQGYYVEGLCFLTGESRKWNQKFYIFDRVNPKRPLKFNKKDGSDCQSCDDAASGYGAFEVGVRYTYLDLSSQGFYSARLDNVTVGLNWYLNPNSKIQFNYDFLHRSDTNTPAQGNVHALGIRTAFDF